MLQRSLEEHRFACIFNGEILLSLIQLVRAKHVEMQIVGDAIRAHAIIANAKGRSVRHLEHLEHQHEQLI